MVKLFCAIVGEPAFPVEIDGGGSSVCDLKKAIKTEKPNAMRTINASDLKLFLAKKGGAWVRSDDSNVINPQHGCILEQAEELLREEITSRESISDLFGDVPTNTLHVLVVAPKHLLYADRQLAVLLLLDTLTDTTSTSAQSDTLKENLIATYQGDPGTSQKDGTLRCMLLNTTLPSELVVASHLFRRKNAFLCQNLMSFNDIDDVKNGLLLFRPLKQALDAFQVSFIYDKHSDEFRLKVLDPSLRRERLFGNLDQHERKILLRGQILPKHWKRHGRRLAPGTDFDIQTTFGDIEGRSLCFMSLERPYKRCLNLQARLARKTAIEEEWIQPDESEFEDYWSDGMSVAEKIDFFFE